VRIDDYNRQAATLADALGDYPETVAIPDQVREVLHFDDLYRKELVRRKYLQEHRMLPADEPQAEFRREFKVPAAGLELGTALRNLSKNVSVWKKRLGNDRYPDADQKYAMYVALYNEAKSNADAERARIQQLRNDADHDD
jgi:hypothetical protein